MTRKRMDLPRISVGTFAVGFGVLLVTCPVRAAVLVDWTDPGSMGTLGGSTSVTFPNAEFVLASDLSGPSFAYAPGPAAAETLGYLVKSDWTITFSSPVTDLLLYGVYWRGSFAFNSGSTSTVDYTFSMPFTVAAGFGSAAVSGDTLTLPGTGFHNGILRFAGPLSSLSVDTTADGDSAQVLTFGLIPEPRSLSLLVTAGLLLAAGRRGFDRAPI